jgi:hypothetical protein
MVPVVVSLPAGHVWLRVADSSWHDPLDVSWARRSGGRWNPAGSFGVLYLNEDLDTARAQIAALLEPWPAHPEDLREDAPFVLVMARLPIRQRVADALSDRGVEALGLPLTYPLDEAGRTIAHEVCQPIGVAVHESGLRGVWYRSAKASHSGAHELAWFPVEGGRAPRKVGDAVSFRRWWEARDLGQLVEREEAGPR